MGNQQDDPRGTGLAQLAVLLPLMQAEWPDGVALVNDQGRIGETNPAWRRMVAEGQAPDNPSLAQLFAVPSEVELALERAGQGACPQLRSRLGPADGSGRRVELTITRLGPEPHRGLLVFLRPAFEDDGPAALSESRVLQAINRVFREALTCDNEDQLGRTCLAVAEELTGSRFGFFSEINAQGLFDTVAISNPGWDACSVDNPRESLRDLPVRGVRGLVATSGESMYLNRPAEHPAWLPPPPGHPPIHCFLSVAMRHGDRIFGTIGLANKPGGYSPLDLEHMERLAVAILQALSRRRAEDALSDERERLAVTLRSIGDGVIAADAEGRVTILNSVAERLTGWTTAEAAGRPLAEVFRIINEHTREPCENPVDKVLAHGGIVGLANHTILVARDGEEYVLADSAAPIRNRGSEIIGVVLVFRDVTEARRVSEELIKVQRLDSIGRLAGGIAHDFNNLLASMVANIELARITLMHGDDPADLLADAQTAAMRGRALTKQLLTFSKGGAPVRRPAVIGDLVAEAASFALRGSNVHCQLQVAPELPPVDVDEGQIAQVIQNLVINADEAMPQGGTVRVRVERSPAGVPHPPSLEPGSYLRVLVMDQGIGIPPEVRAHIFEPFFSTKQRGSGLGLATSYAIVSNHDGHIEVADRHGGGSTFTVYLPITDESPPEAPAVEPMAYGAGRVLVMDDDESLGTICCRMLRHLGYDPHHSPSGEAALDAWIAAREQGVPFDVVLLDLTVPGGMGGRETLERMRRVDPQVKAIVCSGYSSDPVMSDYAKHGFREVLDKPFSMRQIALVLRDLLER